MKPETYYAIITAVIALVLIVGGTMYSLRKSKQFWETALQINLSIGHATSLLELNELKKTQIPLLAERAFTTKRRHMIEVLRDLADIQKQQFMKSN